MAGVGHQHAIAAGQRQIGGQRRALVAALLLDDLDEQHLAAPDDVLDLVAAAQRLALLAELVGGALLGATGIFGTRRALLAGLGFVAALAVVATVAVVIGALGLLDEAVG